MLTSFFLGLGCTASPAPTLPVTATGTPSPEPTDEVVSTDLPPDPPARVIVVIADDLGVDTLAAYADVAVLAPEARPFPATPTLDAVCGEGVRFDTAWSSPTCTPTRGTILTGSYGFRTGLDGVGNSYALTVGTSTLPGVLPGVATASVGKWHLGQTAGGLSAPNQVGGWSSFQGTMDNLDDYFSWPRVDNGVETMDTRYATTGTIDDALSWWATLPPEAPALLWVAFHAPHIPFHVPPAGLHQQGNPTTPEGRYDAAVEALDTELGRLLTTVGDDVLVIFIGDNGTPGRAVRTGDADRAKGTLFEGGLHVPLCVRGPGVVAGRHDGLVQSVDLFRTVTDWLGAEVPVGVAPDAVSLLPVLLDPAGPPVRTYGYSEQNRTLTPKAGFRGGSAVRDARFKWIGFEDGGQALYDLQADPVERIDLSTDPAYASDRARLVAWHDALRSTP